MLRSAEFEESAELTVVSERSEESLFSLVLTYKVETLSDGQDDKITIT
jgi:hypothetical protein